MKNCVYCFTDIHKRAVICPSCRQSQTWSRRAGGMLTTVFPILAALISISFAIYERAQAEFAVAAKQVAETELEVEQIKQQAAEETLLELSRELPRFSMMQQVPRGDSEAETAVAEQLQRISEAQHTELQQGKPSRQSLRQLEKDRLQLLIQHPHLRAGAASSAGTHRR